MSMIFSHGHNRNVLICVGSGAWRGAVCALAVDGDLSGAMRLTNRFCGLPTNTGQKRSVARMKNNGLTV